MSQELTDKIRSGDEGAFRLCVDEFQTKVLNTCHGFVKNKEEAEDLTQEVFIEVYKSISKFRDESQLSTWIYRIAVNKSLDLIRSKKRKKRFSKLLSIGENEEEEIQIPHSETPEYELEKAERKKVLHEALNTLPENQRTALVLSKIEGFGNKEIAGILDTSLSAVDSLIHRGKKNLHDLLCKYYKKHL